MTASARCKARDAPGTLQLRCKHTLGSCTLVHLAVAQFTLASCTLHIVHLYTCIHLPAAHCPLATHLHPAHLVPLNTTECLLYPGKKHTIGQFATNSYIQCLFKRFDKKWRCFSICKTLHHARFILFSVSEMNFLQKLPSF